MIGCQLVFCYSAVFAAVVCAATTEHVVPREFPHDTASSTRQIVSPAYLNAAPYAKFDFAGQSAVNASYKCKSNSAGGRCDGGDDPSTATGTHDYEYAENAQALPSDSLTAGATDPIAGTPDGAMPTSYACAPTCATASVSGPHNIRAAAADSYPRATPNSSAAYTDAKPVPEGGALGGATVGPAYAADPFHIDWDEFCLKVPAHCTGGNPNYVGHDSAMVADTLPTSLYGAGVSTMCAGALAYTPGNTQCNDGVGVYYSATSDPVVTVTCDGPYGCGAGPNGSGNLSGSRIFIPKGALAQQGGDGHMNVRQPSGTICQLYFGADAHTIKMATTSIHVSAGACGAPNFSTEGSTYFSDGGYAANDEMSRAFLRPEDVVGNNGDGTDSGDPDAFYHALYGSFSNNQRGVVWPAVTGDGRCTSSSTINGAMPYEGMYLYIDGAGFRAVKSWNPPVYLRWLKRALGSIHRHGMIDMDSSGCTTRASSIYVNTLEWGSQSYVRGGGTSPLDAYLAKFIHPYDSSYVPSGSESAIYLNLPSQAYAFAVLWYRDVPGLAASNFHWIDKGCGQLAVQGSSNSPC